MQTTNIKNKQVTNQQAFEYAFYMIATSYFGSAKCLSKRLEKRLLMEYKELKLQKQYEMEQSCISYMNSLKKQLPPRVFRGDVVVRMVRLNPYRTGLEIRGDRFVLELFGIYRGKQSEFFHRLWVK